MLLADPGVDVRMTVKARADAAAGVFTSTAAVTSATGDNDLANNSTSATTTLASLARLLLEKQTDTPNPASMQVFKYLLTARNVGSSSAMSVTIADALPAEVEYVQATHAGCPAACAVGDIGPGQVRTVEISVRLRSSVAGGVRVTNRGQVSSATPLAAGSVTNASVDVVTIAAADLQVRTYGDPNGVVAAGQPLVYTVLVDNHGPGEAKAVVITDTLNSDGAYQYTAPAFCSPAGNGEVTGSRVLTCVLGDIAAGAQRTFQVTLTAATAQSVRSTVDGQSGSFDPDSSNNQATVQHTVSSVSDVELTMSAVGSFTAGEVYTYALTVANHGPSPATNVQVVDPLPVGLAVRNSLVAAGLGQCAVNVDAEQRAVVTCGLGSIPSGATRVIEVGVLPAAALPAGTVLHNGATLSTTSSDPNNANNYAAASARLNAASAVVINTQGAPNPVLAGDLVSYRIEVQNWGPSVLRNVDVRDLLVEGGQYLTLEKSTITPAANGNCVQAVSFASEVRCHLGDLDVGPVYRIDLQLRVHAATPPETWLKNEVRLEADSAIRGIGGVTSTALQVATQARLEIVAAASTQQPLSGQTFNYNISVTNRGPSVARNVRVQDVLPAEVQYLYSTAPGCPSSCMLGTLLPGQTKDLQVTVRLGSNVAGGTAVVNTALVLTDTPLHPDSVTTAAATIIPIAVSDLKVRKFGSPIGKVSAGQAVDYTIIVDNFGPGAARNVLVEDLLDSEGRYSYQTPELLFASIQRAGRRQPVVHLPPG